MAGEGGQLSNLSDFQFKLLVGQEYELEHKLEGRPKPISEKLGHNDQVKGETRERLAKQRAQSEPINSERLARLGVKVTPDHNQIRARMELEKNRRNSPTPI